MTGRSNRVDCWACKYYIESNEMRATCLHVRTHGYVPLECMPDPPCDETCPWFQPIELRRGVAGDVVKSQEEMRRSGSERYKKWARGHPDQVRSARIAARSRFAVYRENFNERELQEYRDSMERMAKLGLEDLKKVGERLAAELVRQDKDRGPDEDE